MVDLLYHIRFVLCPFSEMYLMYTVFWKLAILPSSGDWFVKLMDLLLNSFSDYCYESQK